MTNERPVCVTVIGWGAIVVAVFLAFCGAMGGAMWVATREEAAGRAASASGDFVFEHFGVIATLQVVAGLVLVVAGRGLLRLRRSASGVVQAVAWLGLGYLAVAVVYTVVELHRAAAESSRPAPLLFIVMMVATSAFVVVVWTTPLVLSIRSLRSERVRGALR